MTIEQVVILALIQGITEFLPISSSGHLILLPILTGWADQGLITDVMVHMGSFLAVIVYFWRDVMRLAKGGLNLLSQSLRHQLEGTNVKVLQAFLPFKSRLKVAMRERPRKQR